MKKMATTDTRVTKLQRKDKPDFYKKTVKKLSEKLIVSGVKPEKL